MQVYNKHLLTQLTWLRGVAATLVVVSHCIRTTEGVYLQTQTTTGFGIIRYFDLGTFGVMLFFALSGATLYISNKNIFNLTSLYQFYIKRFFRIWPAFSISLLIYIAFMPIFQAYYISPKGNWIEFQFLTDWTFVEFLRYLSLSFNIQGPSGLFNNAYWSLPVEFQYYLVFPLLILSMRYTNIVGPIVIAIISYFIHRNGYLNMDSTWVFMLAFTFCFGIVFAHFHEKIKPRLHYFAGLLCFFCLFTVCSMFQQGVIQVIDLPVISNPFGINGIFGLLCMATLLFTNFSFGRNNLFVKPLYWIGERSYSIYLYHNLILGIMVILCIQMQNTFLVENPVLLFATVFCLSSLVGSISYKWIELPAINISRTLIKRI